MERPNTTEGSRSRLKDEFAATEDRRSISPVGDPIVMATMAQVFNKTRREGATFMETILLHDPCRTGKNRDKALALAQIAHQMHSGSKLPLQGHEDAMLLICWHLDAKTIGASIRRIFP